MTYFPKQGIIIVEIINMQTFLPYSSFKKTAKCLDNKRLGKQRVEAMQILKVLTGETEAWKNHPAVKMWKGYESALAYYALWIVQEWKNRGYKDTCEEKIINIALRFGINDDVLPPFIGDEKFHKSHKSNLLRKNPEHYGQFNWKVSTDLPYVWPVK